MECTICREEALIHVSQPDGSWWGDARCDLCLIEDLASGKLTALRRRWLAEHRSRILILRGLDLAHVIGDIRAWDPDVTIEVSFPTLTRPMDGRRGADTAGLPRPSPELTV